MERKKERGFDPFIDLFGGGVADSIGGADRVYFPRRRLLRSDKPSGGGVPPSDLGKRNRSRGFFPRPNCVLCFAYIHVLYIFSTQG